MLGLTRKRFTSLLVVVAMGLVFLVCGIVFNDLVDLMIHMKINKALPLKNGTIAFKFWQKPPVPVQFGIYVFDIVNMGEILRGEPPVVIEKGPYVYSMHIEKTDVTWHDNDTVEYIQPQSFVFNRAESVGPDTDTFTTVNIPYITVATILQSESRHLQHFVDDIFTILGEETFMTRSVYEIWWGYEDPALETVANVLHLFNKSSQLFNGKFGFFMNRNNTGDGLYNVYSGLNGQFDNYVYIDRWNGMKNLSVWYSDYANEIRGTDGAMHPPFVTADSKLSVFDAYLYRSLKLEYSSPSSYQGVRTLRFLVPFSEFAASNENPDNAGFCTPNCIPSGAYNMSVVSYDAPVYVSLPHFVGGDPYYQTQVRGLRPVQSHHQPFYDIHSITGVSMAAARRYQINIRTQSFEYFQKYQHFPVSYLPVLWIDGVAKIDSDTVALFKGMIQDTMDVMPYFRGTIFAIGGVLLFISTALFIYWRRKSIKNSRKYSIMVGDENSPLNEEGNSSSTFHNPSDTQTDDSAAVVQISTDSDVPALGDDSIFPTPIGSLTHTPTGPLLHTSTGPLTHTLTGVLSHTPPTTVTVQDQMLYFEAHTLPSSQLSSNDSIQDI